MEINLKFKLMIALIIIGVVPIVITGALTYNMGRASTEKQVLSQIISIADLKEESIDNWFFKKINDLQIQSEDSELILFLMNESSDNFSYQGIENNLKNVQKSNGHRKIFITDRLGKVIFSTEKRDIDKILNEEYIQSPINTYEHRIEALTKSSEGSVMFISGPVFAFDFNKNIRINEIVGVIVLELNIEEELFSQLGTWPGRGETGEILVVRNEDSTILFLNELRHKENTSLNFRIPIDSEFAKPAIFASQGDEGILKTLDYRGIEVLAAYRHINIVDWGLVTKIDTSEAFADIFVLRNRIILVTLFMLFVIILSAVFISVIVTKKERQKIDQLERFAKVAIGREKKMIELKKEIANYEKRN